MARENLYRRYAVCNRLLCLGVIPNRIEGVRDQIQQHPCDLVPGQCHIAHGACGVTLNCNLQFRNASLQVVIGKINVLVNKRVDL